MNTKKPIIYYFDSVDQKIIKQVEKMGEVQHKEWKNFGDGWMDYFLDDIRKKRHRDIIFIASFNSSDAISRQMSIIYAIPRYRVRSFKVIFSEFPDIEEPSDFDGLIMNIDTAMMMLRITPDARMGRVKFYRLKDGDISKLEEIDVYGYSPFSRALKYAEVPENSTPICFHHPLRKDMSKSIAQINGYDLGRVYREPSEKNKNFMYQAVVNDECIVGRDVIYIASFHSPGSFFEEMGVIYRLSTLQINTLRVVIPFFPVGTMERVDIEGQIATAKTMSRILSSIPKSEGERPVEIIIYDIHALQGWFYFDDNVLVDLRSVIPTIYEMIKDILDIAVAYPDDGAYKRFGKGFPDIPEIICNKVREGDKRIVTIKEGNPKGKNVINVDDLIQTCTTNIECRNALMAAEAKSVGVVVPHGVFPNESWRKMITGLFHFVWIFDSCAERVKEIADYLGNEVFVMPGDCPADIINEGSQKSFRIFSMAPIIARDLKE